jgi:ABC-type Mn2+/Zn2+ transport system ATPase subunit
MLAFRQIMKLSTGKDPNIVFFDEVAENIDEEGLQWLYDVLADLAKTCHVYVITHNAGLSNLLKDANKIVLQKQNGSTKLVCSAKVA